MPKFTPLNDVPTPGKDLSDADESLYYYKDDIKSMIFDCLNMINGALDLKVASHLLRDCQSLIMPYLFDENLSKDDVLAFDESFICA